MAFPAFASADAVSAYLTTRPLEIICRGCGVDPARGVSPDRQRWYTANHHRHVHREILIPLSGRNLYGYEGVLYGAHPGRAIFFDADEEHEVLYPEQVQPVRHLWLSLLAEHATAYVYETRPGQGQPHIRRRVLMRYASMGIQPDRLWRCEDALPLVIRIACLRVVAEVFLLRWFDYAEAQQEETDSIEHQRRMVQAVQAHIDQTAGRDVSLDRMAELAGYSKFHFFRLFRQHADCTLHAYVDSCRRRRVEEMRRSGQTDKAIAEALGFSGPTAFSRWKRTQQF